MVRTARHITAPDGRYCHLCGRGMSYRMGGLLAIGYHPDQTIQYAHLRCQQASVKRGWKPQ